MHEGTWGGLGTAPVKAKGRRRDWAEGGTWPQDSLKGALQLILDNSILQSLWDVWCPRKGARPRAGDSSHLSPPLKKATAVGHLQVALPAAGVIISPFFPKGNTSIHCTRSLLLSGSPGHNAGRLLHEALPAACSDPLQERWSFSLPFLVSVHCLTPSRDVES